MQKIIDIQIRSKKEAIQFNYDRPWAAISISSEGDYPTLKEENRVGCLQMSFYDSEDTGEGDNYFSKYKAQKILDFMKIMLPKIDCLLVHCEMGASRSPAVAASISNILWGPQTERIYFKNYTPNMLVYRTILETYKEA